jgi:hypothetical protein
MVPLIDLWMPIVLSAVIVFIASSVMHMVLPYHTNDYQRLPEEDKLLTEMRTVTLKRGMYMFPHCTHKEMNSPAMEEKRKIGPVGILTILPSGPMSMGKYLGMWFGYCLVVGTVVAYLAGMTIPRGTPYMDVFRMTAAAGFLGYGVSTLSNGVWKGVPWSVVVKEVFDGLVYALLTAGTFGWLWPK